MDRMEGEARKRRKKRVSGLVMIVCGTLACGGGGDFTGGVARGAPPPVTLV